MLTTKKSTQNSGRLLRESKDGWKFRTYNAVRGLFDFDALENGIIDIEKGFE